MTEDQKIMEELKRDLRLLESFKETIPAPFKERADKFIQLANEYVEISERRTKIHLELRTIFNNIMGAKNES